MCQSNATVSSREKPVGEFCSSLAAAISTQREYMPRSVVGTALDSDRVSHIQESEGRVKQVPDRAIMVTRGILN
jgi:hypothetical protein